MSCVGPVVGDEAKNGEVKVGVDLVDEGKPRSDIEMSGSSSTGIHGTVSYIS